MTARRLALLLSFASLGTTAAFFACSSDPTPQNPADAGSDGTTDGGDAGDGRAPIPLDCTAYCTTIDTVCTGANLQYLDVDTCKAMCAKLTVGTAGATSGNTLACRAYHLGVASTSAEQATAHCGHAGPFGFGGCGGELEDFCFMFQAQCGNTFGASDCVAAAGQIPNLDGGPLGTTLGYSIDCREYHLENAYKAGDVDGGGHCSHATKDSIANHCEK